MMKKAKGKNTASGKLLPNSWKIVSSCLKTVSTNASTVVRTAGASVAASIASSTDDHKDQVTWAGFDKLEYGPAVIKNVLLLGYLNGFQVIDVEDALNISELVSKRDGPVTFLQMLPAPTKYDMREQVSSLHPVLLVVGGDEDKRRRPGHNNTREPKLDNSVSPSKAVRFYSLRSNCYVKVLSFPSAVFMVRSSPWIIAVGLKSQIYCIDNHTLEKKFIVSTYPVPQFEGQGPVGIKTGYGPMAVGPRWLAYAPDNPYVSSTGRLSPKNLARPGVSPSTSPGNSSLMAHYAVESGKHFASGIMNLGDVGYKTLSKYCPDLLPDGTGSPGWKVGKLTASEIERAGMVVIKDVISTAVISQFRAHTSQIAALCFDPSGTLLVTASVHGNNINVFRIMPSGMPNEPDCYNWNSSHVHLYKLYRGVTTAIIRDICFSHCSRWISVVSSKGTCHVFVLSPFGGDAHFRTLYSHGEDTFIYPDSSTPWWSTSSFTLNHQESLPPSPTTLSVVTRIKNSSFGLSAAPSGAVSATFHTSISYGPQGFHVFASSLEHLLVYTPSGFVVQHKLKPSAEIELNHGSPDSQPGSEVHMLDEEFSVKVEPVQWWDVCRRSNCPERGGCNSVTTFDGQEGPQRVDNSRMNFPEKQFSGSFKLVKSDTPKMTDRSNWYLSSAEVQMDTGRYRIWQNSEICFHVMSPPRLQESNGGELEIEKIPSHEVEIKEKDLLPVFEHFHSMKPGQFDRRVCLGYDFSASSSENHQDRDKGNEAIVICHSNPASLSSTESSDGGSSRRVENLPELDQLNIDKSLCAIGHTRKDLSEGGSAKYGAQKVKHNSMITTVPFPSEYSSTSGYCVKNSSLGGFPTPSIKSTDCTQNTSRESPSFRTDLPFLNIDCVDFDSDVSTEAPMCPGEVKPIDLEQVFQESYCNKLQHHGCYHSTEDLTH